MAARTRLAVGVAFLIVVALAMLARSESWDPVELSREWGAHDPVVFDAG
jgi:hypothetical protein